MSPNIEVHYGNQRLGWDYLIEIMVSSPQEGVLSPADLVPLFLSDWKGRPHHISLLEAQRRQILQGGKKLPLFSLLYRTLSFKATVDVDKVFALQGVSLEGFSRRLPDYSRSARDVFI